MARRFMTACHIHDLKPGQMKRINGVDGPILLANIDGDYFAVEDRCSHEEVSLYLGCLRGEEIECSLHGGRFNMKTGQATKEPAEENLRTYCVQIVTEQVQVKI